MAYPNTPGERRTFADGWKPANDWQGAAYIWKVETDGKAIRYEADYYRDGRKIDSLTGESLANLIIRLQAKYGPARE